jgi:hypothetical protein
MGFWEVALFSGAAFGCSDFFEDWPRATAPNINAAMNTKAGDRSVHNNLCKALIAHLQSE